MCFQMYPPSCSGLRLDLTFLHCVLPNVSSLPYSGSWPDLTFFHYVLPNALADSSVWLFSTVYLFSGVCFQMYPPSCSGSWLGLAPRELESRCQLCAREIDSRAEIRTRSIAQSQIRNEKCANCRPECRWNWFKIFGLGAKSIALNLRLNHQLHRIQRSI